MRYLDEYRDAEIVKRYAEELHRIVTKRHTIMEVCGGQTHAIMRFGIDGLLPSSVELLHGPGCPVCVTPLEMIERAISLAKMPEVTLCSFGDMLRVPGVSTDLLQVKAKGGDVRVVYSPLDAVTIARQNPKRQVVFFAVGFETTAPANAMAVFQAHREGLSNFSLLVSHVLVPPAIEAILSSRHRVNGFLAAGHVCTIMGLSEYYPIADKYRTPIVATGFEPADIMQGIYLCVKQLEEGRAEVENQYSRAVSASGNLVAQKMLQRVFRVVDRKWRGIGNIPKSGFALSDEFASFDAERRFGVGSLSVEEPKDCISGQILQGHQKPNECPFFGNRCTPDTPMGATMVSSEGACAAYFKYKKIS
jgi:hydrogenase expression/formation protein HypD